MGQDDDELVAPVAGDRVDLAEFLAQQRRDRLEHLVADEVSERVIDVLEAVDIEHDDAEEVAVALAAGDLGIRDGERVAAVVHPGELVGDREPFELLERLAQLALHQAAAGDVLDRADQRAHAGKAALAELERDVERLRPAGALKDELPLLRYVADPGLLHEGLDGGLLLV